MKRMISFIFDNYPCVKIYHLEPLQEVGRGLDVSGINKDFLTYYKKANFYVNRKYKNKKLYCSLFSYQPKNIFCTSMTGETPVINNEGKIMPCSDLLEFEHYGLGKIKFNNFISTGKNRYKELYKKICNSSCSHCKYFYLCGGGCPSSIKRNFDGSIEKNSTSLCKQIKKYWDYEFDLLNRRKETYSLKLFNLEDNKQFKIYKIERI